MDRACFFASGIASAKVDTSTVDTHPFQKALNPIFLVVPGGLIHWHLRLKQYKFEIAADELHHLHILAVQVTTKKCNTTIKHHVVNNCTSIIYGAMSNA